MHRAHATYAAARPDDGELISRHAALIERAARRLASHTGGAVAPEDLWSAGALGLVDAGRRFDPARDVRFETFAEHRIRGAMIDEMRRMDHLPRRLRAKAEEAERTRSRLAQVLKREPTVDEVATELSMTPDELEGLLGAAQPHLELFEGIEAPVPATDDELVRSERSRALAAAVAALPERLQTVLSLHYVEGFTYREIAKVLEVSEPRVCQLHADATAKLKVALAEG